MRWWARLVALGVAVTIILGSLSFWTRCGDERAPQVLPPGPAAPPRPEAAPRQEVPATEGVSDLRCAINEQYSIDCKSLDEEVYLPFSFIKKYFEVYGEMGEEQGRKVFRWSHSYGKVFPPSAPYSPDGEFMYFGSYNVEKRDRVKGISGVHGVPVTTQWLPAGFFYPVQIAQFGLSHYSRNLTDPAPKQIRLIPGRLKDLDRQLGSVTDDGIQAFEFAAHDTATLRVDVAAVPILKFDLKNVNNASISVDVVFNPPSKAVRIHYVCTDGLISAQGSDVYIGLGQRWDGYKHFIRDLSVDATKGVGGRGRRAHKLTPQRLRVQAIRLRGGGRLRRLLLVSSDHVGQFLQAAEWLVRHQRPDTGAWTIPVERHLSEQMILKPDWCSAMGQGQAISVLTRAFRATGDRRYLDAARRATAPFSVDSVQGGVRTHFMDKHVWYEEYPTVPASFVLNGFIYSLMGLYDLAHTHGGGSEAGRLYAEGLRSLEAILLLFDSGSGTFYDLRHVMNGIAPNLARWDYHVTHVNQLLVLATMEPQVKLFSDVAERWTGYMAGLRSAHN